MTTISTYEKLVEAAEDFCDTIFDIDVSEFSKRMGLDEAMGERLINSVKVLTAYKDYMPSDILKAIQDVIKFAMSVSEKSDDETKPDEKIKKAHEWGFSLMPAAFEKEKEDRKRRRKKSGQHQWGFSLADLDIEKEDEDIKKDEDEDDEGDEED